MEAKLEGCWASDLAIWSKSKMEGGHPAHQETSPAPHPFPRISQDPVKKAKPTAEAQ